MRLRPSPVTAYHLARLARQHDRSPSNVVDTMIAAHVRAAHGAPAEVADSTTVDADHEAGRHTLCLHVTGPINRGLRMISENASVT